MKINWWVSIAVFIILSIAAVIFIFNGEGGFRRMVTMSGVYAVEPSGYNVVCFVDKSGGGISCLKK